MTLSAAFVTNGRLDMVASNALGRALYARMLEGPTAAPGGPATSPGTHFLDPGARDFYADWERAADTTVALLRAEAGRDPHDRRCANSSASCPRSAPSSAPGGPRTTSASTTAASSASPTPRSAPLELTYHPLALATSVHAGHTLTAYVAEPGSESEEKFKLLASWSAPDLDAPADSARFER